MVKLGTKSLQLNGISENRFNSLLKKLSERSNDKCCSLNLTCSLLFNVEFLVLL